jgi:hypothetical protein
MGTIVQALLAILGVAFFVFFKGLERHAGKKGRRR